MIIQCTSRRQTLLSPRKVHYFAILGHLGVDLSIGSVGGINGCLSSSLCTQYDSATTNQSNEKGDVVRATEISPWGSVLYGGLWKNSEIKC